MKRNRLRWLTARPIAHRGLHDISRDRPENSLAAFDAAIRAHYGIECDLHPSSDGVPIVFHDNDLHRLTGVSGCVRDRTAAHLRDLRIAGTSENIPTLDDLLDHVDGRAPLVIELKHIPGRDAGFAMAVADRLKRYHGPAAIMSFDAGLVADVLAHAPNLPRGLTAEGDWRTGPRHLRTMLRLGLDFVSYAIDDLPTPAPIFARRALGIPLICWTVRNSEQLTRAKRWADQITFEDFAP